MANHNHHPLQIALLGSRLDKTPHIESITWHDFVKLLARPDTERGKLGLADYLRADKDVRSQEKDGPGWMPCPLAGDGTRKKENVLQIFLLVLDFDKGTSFADIETKLVDYEYVLHSSYSHSPELSKCRVAMPLARPAKPEQVAALFDHFNAQFNGLIDEACGHDCARLYYLPSCPHDAVKHFTYRHHEGALLDPDTVAVSTAPAALTSTEPTEAVAEEAAGIDFERGYSDGERTHELTRRVGSCLGRGLSVEDTVKKCQTWNKQNQPPLDESKVLATCESIAKTHSRKTETESREASAQLESLNSDYAWVRRLSRIFRFKHGDFITVNDFKNTYMNQAIRTALPGDNGSATLGQVWLKWPKRRTHEDVVFAPGMPDIHKDCINLWKGWGCESVTGDIKPWETLLDFVFSGDPKSRRWFEQWAAYPIQHPGAKLSTATIFWSTQQGVGKTLIGETIGKLYSPAHFRIITAAELHGSFNGWAKGTQFVLGEENASSDRRADSNKLKHLITGTTVTVNEKHQPAVELTNTMNFLFTSNHPDAFHLEVHDRRFFVWEVSGEPLSDEFYTDFIDWRDNRSGREALMHHFKHLDLTGFNPHAAAPETPAKREMMEVSRSDVERWLRTFVGEVRMGNPLEKEIVTLEELVKAYYRKTSSHTNTTAMGKALIRLGVRSKRRIATKDGRPFLYPITRVDHWEKLDSDTWRREYEKRSSIASF